MSFTIGKFVTRCRASDARRQIGAIADRVARERMGSALAEHFGPSLSRLPAIVRIRRVRVGLRMAAERVNEETLTQAWVQAFGRELFKSLAWPSGLEGVEILRYDTEAEFRATFIRDLLSGEAERCWQYDEFRSYFARPVTESMELLLSESAGSSLETLTYLYQSGWLELAVSRLDDLAIERLFRMFGSTPDSSADLTIQDIVRIARSTAVGPVQSPLESRQQALYQFVRARKEGLGVAPRVILRILSALAFIARTPGGLASVTGAYGDVIPNRIDGIAVPAAIQPVVRKLGEFARVNPHHPVLEELASCIADLQSLVRGAVVPAAAAAAESLQSDVAGLFLLAPLIARSHEIADIRASKFLLAGLALSVLGRFDPGLPSLDPGLAIFAGFTAEPDLAGMRRYFAAGPDRRIPLAESARQLLLDFAARVRGFRHAPPPAIVNQFIAQPGHIHISERRINVSLAPSPYHVALHIAGMDGETIDLDWLGGRRLYIYLEGL